MMMNDDDDRRDMMTTDCDVELGSFQQLQCRRPASC